MYKGKVAAIIGGGPSGLLAALTLAKEGVLTTLFERNPSVGAKLLLTGGGQCNLTNQASVEELLTRYGANGSFLKDAFHLLPPDKLMSLFSSMGLPLVVKEEGRVFPASHKAQDVVDTLYNECRKAGVTFRLKTTIEKIKYQDPTFTLKFEGKEEHYDTLLIATGGASFPHTGSQGDGWRFAKDLGHKIVPVHPALSGVRLVDSTLTKCSGITIEEAQLTFNKRQFRGPLLITHRGLSGPLILNTSRYFSGEEKIRVSFLPNPEGVGAELKKLISQKGGSQLVTLVNQLGVPANLVSWLLEEGKIDGRRKAAEVGRKVIQRVVSLLTQLELKVSLKGALKGAMVSGGGVALEEVDTTTLQSKLVEGLFFAGEVLDIDGDSGGYNLQAAFSTGYAAARGMVTFTLKQ
jgi:predicted Rossmann fold flavoprotein